MARAAAVNPDAVQALGAEKLASLILDEVASNPTFKRRVAAALAGRDGPVALAKVLDKRLAGLERARSFVDWDKARGFRDDLAALLSGIVTELAPQDPSMAMDRLIRFIATHEAVFERIDDSGGQVQQVYRTAIDSLGPLAARLPSGAASALAGLIMERLGEMAHGYLPKVAAVVIPHLSMPACAAWDAGPGPRRSDGGAPLLPGVAATRPCGEAHRAAPERILRQGLACPACHRR